MTNEQNPLATPPPDSRSSSPVVPSKVTLEEWLLQTRDLHDALFHVLDLILTALEPSSHTPRLRRALSSVRSRTRTPSCGASADTCSLQVPLNEVGVSDMSELILDGENAGNENTACVIAALLRTVFAVTSDCERTVPAQSEDLTMLQQGQLDDQSPHQAVGSIGPRPVSVANLLSQATNQRLPKVIQRRQSLPRVVSAPSVAAPPAYSELSFDLSSLSEEGSSSGELAREFALRNAEIRLAKEVSAIMSVVPEGRDLLPPRPDDDIYHVFTSQISCLAAILALRSAAPSTEQYSLATSPDQNGLMNILAQAPPSPSSEADELPIYTELYPTSTNIEVSRRIRAANEMNGQSQLNTSLRDLSEQRWCSKDRPSPNLLSRSSHPHGSTPRRHSLAPTGLPEPSSSPTSCRIRYSTSASSRSNVSPASSMDPLVCPPSSSNSARRFMAPPRLSRIHKRSEAQRTLNPKQSEATNLGEQISRNSKRTRMENQKVVMSDRMWRDMELARLSGHMERLNERRLDNQQWHSPAQRLQRELEKLASGYIRFDTSRTSEAFKDQRFFLDEGKKREMFMKQVEGRINRLPRLQAQDAAFRT